MQRILNFINLILFSKKHQTFGSEFLLKDLHVSGSQTWHFKGGSVSAKSKKNETNLARSVTHRKPTHLFTKFGFTNAHK